MRMIFLLFFLCQCFLAGAQTATTASKVMSLDDYIRIVKTNHPVFYQVEQMRRMATENLRMARGGFDPKLSGALDAKAFDDKNYYNILDAGVKVPTWIGVDVKAGYERSRGLFLDDSQELPPGGLFYAGISVPLGKGLIIDERRAELRRAEIYISANEAEQIVTKNELVLDAVSAYFSWLEAFQNLEIARDGVSLAETRLRGSISSFRNGDIPAIDTLESFISLQNREIAVSKAEQNYVKAVFQLNNFLWLEGVQPLELDENTVPEIISIEFLTSEIDSLYLLRENVLAVHPELLIYEYKLQDLDIDRRLAVESLKPDLRVDYNPLYETGTSLLPRENYRYGVSASFPLFLRKERGKLRMTRAKIDFTRYDMEIKRTQLINKLEEYYRLQDQLYDQNIIIAASVENYDRMVTAENRKFEIGESSIFLVNSREVKYLESRYKLVSGIIDEVYARLLFIFHSGSISEVLLK